MSLLQMLLDGRIEEFNGRRGQRVTLDFFAADLAGLKLAGVDLSGANLEKADLSGADLTGAVLARANLSGADLTGATLHRCVAIKAKFREAYLGDAVAEGGEFSGADFTEADLSNFSAVQGRFGGARFKECTAPKSNFQRADLSEAKLTDGDFQQANFNESVLTGAELSRINLDGASLIGANLQTARMSGAKLRNANLNRAKLVEADLSGADLTGASSLGADITNADLFDVVGGTDALLRTQQGVNSDPEPVVIADSIHVDQPCTAQIGQTLGVIWDNTSDEEDDTTICVALLTGAELPRILHLPVASEQVLTRTILPNSAGLFTVVVLLESPGGVVMQVHDLSLAGELSAPKGVRLGYTPVVRPIFLPDGDGFLIYGIGRQGALSVHRHDANGLKELMRAPAGTYRGFCGHVDPILLGKGGNLAAVRPDGIGKLLTAPSSYPGRLTAAAARESSEQVAVAWTTREERGLRFLVIGADEPTRIDAKLEIGSVELLNFGERWLLAWTREASKGGDPTVPMAWWLPGGKPFPLLSDAEQEEITDIRPVFSEKPMLALVTFTETLVVVEVGEEGGKVVAHLP